MAAIESQATSSAAPTKVVGQRLARQEAKGLVSGRVRYVGDIYLHGMLHVKAKLSPYPNARILSIDTSRAEAHPGVIAVVTHEDVPNNRHGIFTPDQPVLADEFVRHIGEPIAAVAAVDEITAADAVELIDVQFEPLEPLLDALAGLEPGAPEAHEGGNLAPVNEGGAREQHIRKGDVEAGFAEADIIVESEFTTQVREHAPMETHASVAEVDGTGKVTIHSCSQAPHLHQISICSILNLPYHRVRLAGGRVGGGFGSKNDLCIDHITALLALKTQRPVKWLWTREEECLLSSKDQAFARLKFRSGVKQDGTIVAREVEAVRDNGAYTIFGVPDAVTKVGVYAPGPYKIPSYHYKGQVVFTNKPSAGAMRGYNVADAHYACEAHTDEIADALGIDPMAFRWRTFVDEGDESSTGAPIVGATIRQCMQAAADAFGWKLTDDESVKPKVTQPSNPHKLRGIGVCAGWQGSGSTGGGDTATAEVEILVDGSIICRTGAVEIGAGEGTTLGMIVAEELGVSLDAVTMVLGDTESTPFDLGTLGNRITYLQGVACKRAAAATRDAAVAAAAQVLEVDEDDLEYADGTIKSKSSDKQLTLAEVGGAAKFALGRELVGHGSYLSSASALDPETGLGNPTEQIIFAAMIVEVEVDTRTGKVEIVRSVLAHDVGKAINPLFVEGQMDGGMAFGIANALIEDFYPDYPEVDTGARGLHEYKLARMPDMPDDHTNVIVEIPSRHGAFGAKALGEYTANLQAPAIVNAIHDATGVWVRSLPATPPKLLRALKEAGVS
jgi:CO/xanthine dehydrogenase Mo-binding subunit